MHTVKWPQGIHTTYAFLSKHIVQSVIFLSNDSDVSPLFSSGFSACVSVAFYGLRLNQFYEIRYRYIVLNFSYLLFFMNSGFMQWTPSMGWKEMIWLKDLISLRVQKNMTILFLREWMKVALPKRTRAIDPQIIQIYNEKKIWNNGKADNKQNETVFK